MDEPLNIIQQFSNIHHIHVKFNVKQITDRDIYYAITSRRSGLKKLLLEGDDSTLW